MYKEELEQYKEIIEEINCLDRRIKLAEKKLEAINNGGLVIDKVTGGEGGWQSFKIEGFPQKEYDKQKKRIEKLYSKLIDKKVQLINMENEIEDYIDTIPRGRDRTIFRMIFLEGRSQQYTATKFNLDQSRISQIIKKNCSDSYNS